MAEKIVEFNFTAVEMAAVLLAMGQRCEEESHNWENCCSPMLQIYMRCKWCGKVKGVSRGLLG